MVTLSTGLFTSCKLILIVRNYPMTMQPVGDRTVLEGEGYEGSFWPPGPQQRQRLAHRGKGQISEALWG